jgi:hypothetical protein
VTGKPNLTGGTTVDPEHTITRHLFVCKTSTCNQLYVSDVDEDLSTGIAPKCPTCGKTLVDVDNPEIYTTCVAVGCKQYLSTVATGDGGRCEGNRGPKKSSVCKLPLVELSFDEIDDLPEGLVDEVADETGSDAPARRLKAAIARADKWVAGSGSHHRSKGGSHTSSAREKHSAASKSKAQVRDSMAAQIKELMTEVSESKSSDPSLLKKAEVARKAVLGK